MVVYDEIEIEDMTFELDSQLFTYPCPCGDKFQVSLDDLFDESTDIATCPNCGLEILVKFEMVRESASSLVMVYFTNTFLQDDLLKYRSGSPPDSVPPEVFV